MKHKTIKKYIKLGILLFGFSIVLWNCVDERDFLDDEISEYQFEEYQMRSVKRYEIPERIINFIDQASSGTKQVQFNKATGGVLFSKNFHRSSDNFGTIDESQAVIVPYQGEARYTFLVVPDQQLDNEVINLIVVENEEGIEEYFIKYHFDGSSESRDLSTRSSGDLTSFSGTVTYYDKNGNQTGQTTMSNGSTVDTTGDGIPCPPDEEPDPNDDPNNNTTNGGNTTGNGGQAGDGNQPGDGVDPNHDDTSGGGDLVDPDQCTVITNHICSEGDAEPHGSECVSAGGIACAYMCGGTFTTITDHCTGSSITFRTNNDLVETECENTTGVILGTRRECKKINTFLNDPQNDSFKQKLQEMASPSNANQYANVDFETSITIHEFHSDIELREGDPNSRSVNLSYVLTHSNRVKGFAHIHPNGVGTNGTYSVFSFEDLIGISKFLDAGKLDTNNFVAFLITKKGDKYTYYALTINNKSKFQDFFYYYNDNDFNVFTATQEQKDKRLSSFNKSNELRGKYYDRDDAKIRPENINNELMMKEFLAFTSEANMGVTLFESDETFSNFTKVSLRNPSQGSSSDVKRDDCN